jgi:hypothetical protein
MIKDYKMDPSGKTSLKCINLELGTSATGQTAKKTDAVTPGFAFRVVKVEVYALTVTATIAADVHIGTTSVLASTITPVADTPTAGTLSTTDASLLGTSTGILSLKYTSNGSGAATNLRARVWIRAQPLNGEVAR